MASSLALKKLLSSNIVPSSLRSIRGAVHPATSRPASRLFNTNALREFEEGDDRSVEADRRSGNRYPFRRTDLLSDVFDPFSSTRSLSQILNAMDHVMDLPFGGTRGIRRGWDAKETEDGLYLRMDMPGLGKEDVKISVEQNTLVVKGEGEKESEDENSRVRFSSRVDIPDKFFKLDQIKAEMKNGVLKVMIPRVKEEERKDVINVNVE